MIIFKATIFVAAFAAAFLVMYVIGAFAYWNFDPSTWTQGARVLVSTFSAMAAFVLAALAE